MWKVSASAILVVLSLTVGPGGRLFVTEYTANKIARVAVG